MSTPSTKATSSGGTPPKGLNAKARREWIRRYEESLRGIPAAELHSA